MCALNPASPLVLVLLFLTLLSLLLLPLLLLRPQDIALDGLVYWVPSLIHALLDGTAVTLQQQQQLQRGVAPLGNNSGIGGAAAAAAPASAAAVAAAAAAPAQSPLPLPPPAASHCGTPSSQLRAVLLSAIPFGSAAVAAIALGHSSEVRNERRLHIGLPLLAGGAAFCALPALLSIGGSLPAFVAVAAAVVAADATTGPFWVRTSYTQN